MKYIKINTASIFLIIGIIGSLMMIFVRILYGCIERDIYFEYLGPGTLTAIASVIFIITGIIGILMFLVNLFQKNKSRYKITNLLLVAANSMLFIITGILYAAV